MSSVRCLLNTQETGGHHVRNLPPTQRACPQTLTALFDLIAHVSRSLVILLFLLCKQSQKVIWTLGLQSIESIVRSGT